MIFAFPLEKNTFCLLKLHTKNQFIISNLTMHRKYTTSKTTIINTHTFLVEGQSKETHQSVLFHQLLVNNEYAPLLLNERHLQNYISQHENQNVVSQTKEGFQTYFDGSLIQIKIKQGLRLLSDLAKHDLGDILELFNALNLDYALAVKQIISNTRHNQRQSLSNCCKFYQNFILPEGNNETILPFMQLSQHKIHYYDIYFGSVFPKNSQKCSNSELSTPQIQNNYAKKPKLKSGFVTHSSINPTHFLSEEISFRRYLLFLCLLLTTEDSNQIAQNLKNALRQSNFEEELKIRVDRLTKKLRQMPENCLFQLLLRCLTMPQDYNIHIFQKQCQILRDKYCQLKSNKRICEGSQKDKKKLSLRAKSMISSKSSKYIETNTKVQVQQKVKHLKRSSGREGSKSEITLNKNIEKKHLSQEKKGKRPNLDIFKKTKPQTSNPLSPIIEQAKSNSKERTQNQNNLGSVSKLINFRKVSYKSSKWVNYSSLNESEVCARLRNFKKSSHLFSVQPSPQKQTAKQQKESASSKPQQTQQIDSKYTIQIKQPPEDKKQTDKVERSAKVSTEQKILAFNKSTLTRKQSNYKEQNTAIYSPPVLRKSASQNIQISYPSQHDYVVFKQRQQNIKQSPKLLEKHKLHRKHETKSFQFRKTIKPKVILSQTQKNFYKKHFQLILNFFKQNLLKINSIPQISNLVYLVYILYYKCMTESFKSQSYQKYKELGQLIIKKQTKIEEQKKDNYLIYIIRPQQMYQSSIKIQELESLLNKGSTIAKIEDALDYKYQISSYIQITEQACQLIDQILAELYNYIRANKSMLMTKDILNILLELGYLVAETRIMCGQRLSFYNNVKQSNFQNLYSIFSYHFKNSEDQHLAEYQKRLAGKDMTHLDVSQEFNYLKALIKRFV